MYPEYRRCGNANTILQWWDKLMTDLPAEIYTSNFYIGKIMADMNGWSIGMHVIGNWGSYYDMTQELVFYNNCRKNKIDNLACIRPDSDEEK